MECQHSDVVASIPQQYETSGCLYVQYRGEILGSVPRQEVSVGEQCQIANILEEEAPAVSFWAHQLNICKHQCKHQYLDQMTAFCQFSLSMTYEGKEALPNYYRSETWALAWPPYAKQYTFTQIFICFLHIHSGLSQQLIRRLQIFQVLKFWPCL